jgi:AraC-like DNA-binding protein
VIGSHLLGQQPTFAGADFGIPEVALFGYYQFRSAVPTSDTWELHDGAEFLFMQSGEACWELADEHFSMVTGNQALVFPSGQRHRISNGIYTPCRLFWIVFRPVDTAREVARLFLASEVEALAEIAKTQERPVDLSLECRRNLGELCARLTDERLLIGSATMTAEVRSRIYSAVTSMWEVLSSGAHSGAQSRLVRRAAALLRTDAAARDYSDHEESIEEVAHQLGYGKSHLYNLFTREVGMAPNDYRQRVRIKRCCERLAKGNDPITTVALDNGFRSTQYFARVFKKYVGVTASDYRELFQAN